MKIRKFFVFITVILLFQINQTGPSFAGSNSKITACANKKTGVLRLATKCKTSETKIVWNQAGLNGSVIHNGETLPNTESDPIQIGDYFLVTSTMTLYGPKTDKGWPNTGFTLRGPSGGGGGGQGPRGAIGPQGPQGPTGGAGPTGPAGAQGIQGLQGTAGTIDGTYASLILLEADHPYTHGVDPVTKWQGESYLVGGNLYVWSIHTESWENVGNIAGPQGIQGVQGDKGDPGTPGFIPKFGWFYDTVDRHAAAINQVTPLSCDSIGNNSNGVTISSDSILSFSTPGTYNIAFSSQIINSDPNNAATISLWLQNRNGGGAWSNIPWSNTDVDIAKKEGSGRKVIAWNFFVPIIAGEDIRLVWQTTAISLYINSSTGDLIKPGIPGTILTVNQVG